MADLRGPVRQRWLRRSCDSQGSVYLADDSLLAGCRERASSLHRDMDSCSVGGVMAAKMHTQTCQLVRATYAAISAPSQLFIEFYQKNTIIVYNDEST
jgi:hypothetical protein